MRYYIRIARDDSIKKYSTSEGIYMSKNINVNLLKKAREKFNDIVDGCVKNMLKLSNSKRNLEVDKVMALKKQFDEISIINGKVYFQLTEITKDTHLNYYLVDINKKSKNIQDAFLRKTLQEYLKILQDIYDELMR